MSGITTADVLPFRDCGPGRPARRLPRVVLDLEKVRHVNCGLGRFCRYLADGILAASQRAIEPVFFMPQGKSGFFRGRGVDRIDVAPWRKELFASLYRPLVRPFRRGRGYDLWHVTNQMSKYLPLDPAVPVVLTIHDLNFLHDAEHRNRGRAVERKLSDIQRKIDRSSVIVTDTRYVARDVRARLHVGDRPVHVVPLGVGAPPPSSSGRPAFLPEGPFLFSVGNALAHKNFHVLFPLVERMPGVRLVVAGKTTTPYGQFLDREIRRRNLAGRVILAGEVGDGDRQWLYEHCEAFLFPSLTEGFGLPVLEAMQCGKPVFMSRRTSLPGVCGTAGFYWDSFDPEHMLSVLEDGMRRVAGDPAAPGRIRDHAASFSWAETARGYLRVYDSLLGAA